MGPVQRLWHARALTRSVDCLRHGWGPEPHVRDALAAIVLCISTVLTGEPYLTYAAEGGA